LERIMEQKTTLTTDEFDLAAHFFIDEEVGDAALAEARRIDDAGGRRQALLAACLRRFCEANPDLYPDEVIKGLAGKLEGMTWAEVGELVRRAADAVAENAERLFGENASCDPRSALLRELVDGILGENG
jgi:hypothetical protein